MEQEAQIGSEEHENRGAAAGDILSGWPGILGSGTVGRFFACQSVSGALGRKRRTQILPAQMKKPCLKIAPFGRDDNPAAVFKQIVR
jgi:hypothetical protein